MEAIRINVSKQMDGYTFSIAPSIRQLIKSWFPNSHPANNIFVAYDTKSDFEVYYNKLESYIYPALLGMDNQSELNKKVDFIQFVDSHTGNILHSHKVPA
ncbi:hypothetical protein [Arcicella rigui]|uniref:Uncharacterized protein n=1 Tax=Arcicella rigui TaxID=797020 RepID=A0ABU5Q7Q1_9BACT|nr:hypothetical protein [Arcicella rigui]MEA5138859.1 hypothetical protein [Arcicella rigui]